VPPPQGSGLVIGQERQARGRYRRRGGNRRKGKGNYAAPVQPWFNPQDACCNRLDWRQVYDNLKESSSQQIRRNVAAPGRARCTAPMRSGAGEKEGGDGRQVMGFPPRDFYSVGDLSVRWEVAPL